MSRFAYRLYMNEKAVGSFSSINKVLILLYDTLTFEERRRIIDAFVLPPFTKRKPQIYEDQSLGMRIESDILT